MKVLDLVNKEVKIYPNDSHSKKGVILEINRNGVYFK